MRLLRIAVVDLNIEYRASSDEQKKEKSPARRPRRNDFFSFSLRHSLLDIRHS